MVAHSKKHPGLKAIAEKSAKKYGGSVALKEKEIAAHNRKAVEKNPELLKKNPRLARLGGIKVKGKTVPRGFTVSAKTRKKISEGLKKHWASKAGAKHRAALKKAASKRK